MFAAAPSSAYLNPKPTVLPSSARTLSPPITYAAASNSRRPVAECHISSNTPSPLSQNPKPSSTSLKTLSKALAAASTVTLILNLRSFSGNGNSGGGGGGFGGGGGRGDGFGGGEDGFGGFLKRLLFGSQTAIADEIVTPRVPSGFVFPSKSTFSNIPQLAGKTNPDGTLGVTISFTESTWQSADKFRCINVGLMAQSKPIEMDPDMTDKEKLEYFRNQEKDYKRRIDRARPCLLPAPVQREVLLMLREQGKVSARLLQKIRDRVQKWYQDEGYACAQVVNFGNLNTKEVVCEVVEGDITQLLIQFQDKLGNIVEGNTQIPVVKRELPRQLRPGYVFNIEAGKQALRNINSLALFSNIEVNPRPDEKNEGGIIVEIKLKELEQKTAELNTEWNIVPGRGGYPTLASLEPGGTVTFEHRNLGGLNRSILGSITTSNFLNPQDDLSFKLEYVHPYLDGVYNPRNRTLRVSCFNSRKLSPVFTGGPGADEVPPIWVDRAGVKANITENFTRQSKFTYGLVMEEITTRDERSHVCSNGQRVLPSGGVSEDGPPTTLSGTGIDRLAFLQSNITRDNTKFVNGAIVGQRNVFQVDQGIGVGSNFPFFNRHQLTLTRFFQLKEVEEGAGKPPPPVLVLHGHYGGCIGDLPTYDAFTLGGPYSVRGYNMGEIGAARNILELAAELRIPVKGTHVYAFAEHGNDLGTSKEVKGNPTEVYRRLGHGSAYGVGVKLGLVRAEYAVDHNSGTGAVFFRFGERF
ncbi:hypothetical protein C1H46_013951 [Malus baccata]|uniref:Uncharacterized protein n=1 Tax=Malus baccata TaxID=106549 RepID=A0A540MQE3_MALBA|nr:hypothetical protein C1H46_013951 [Malus baccata]